MASQNVKLTIGNLQFWMMAISLIITMGHIVYIHIAMFFAGRDTWVSVLIADFVALGLVWVYALALGRGQSVIESATEMLGLWIGKALGWVVASFLLIAGTLTLSNLATFWGRLFPHTPTLLFVFTLLLLSLWLVHSGIESIARLTQLMLPLLVFIGLSVSLLIMKDRDWGELAPVLAHGIWPVWQGAWVLITMFAEALAMLMIVPYVRQPERLPQEGMIVVGILLVMFMGPALGPITVFGEGLAQALTYPTFAEIQYINFTGVLERIDLLGVLLWTAGTLLRTSILLFAAVEAVGRLLQTGRTAIYAVPLTVALAGFTTLLTSSREDTIGFMALGYTLIAVGVGIGIPVLLCVVRLTRSLIAKWA